MVLDVPNLINLFTGDEDSIGYAHEEIVCELCSRSGRTIPVTPEWISEMMYPGLTKAEIDVEIYGIIADGVRLWQKRNKPRHQYQ